jgi:hypothetical protein
MGLVYMRVCGDIEHIFLLSLDYPTFQAFVHRRALLKTLVYTIAYRDYQTLYICSVAAIDSC